MRARVQGSVMVVGAFNELHEIFSFKHPLHDISPKDCVFRLTIDVPYEFIYFPFPFCKRTFASPSHGTHIPALILLYCIEVPTL